MTTHTSAGGRALDVFSALIFAGSSAWLSLFVTFVLMLAIASSLPVLKAAQLEREFDSAIHARLTSSSESAIAVYDDVYARHRKSKELLILQAMSRRIDDPSFWFILTMLATSGCLTGARSLLALTEIHLRLRWRRLSLTVMLILLTAYLLMTWIASEGFFRAGDGTTDTVILTIQRVEASMMVVSYVLGTRLLAAGLTLVDSVHRLLRAAVHQSVARATTWRLIMSSYGAVVVLVSGVALCQALDTLTAAFGPFNGLRMSLLLIQLLPFLFLGAYTKARLGQWFEIRRLSIRPEQLPIVITVLTAGSVFLNRVQQWFQTGLAGLLIAIINVMAYYRVVPRQIRPGPSSTCQHLGAWCERPTYLAVRWSLLRTRLWRR